MFRQFFRLGDADKLAERMTDDCRRNWMSVWILSAS